jgi:hypothetical protein
MYLVTDPVARQAKKLGHWMPEGSWHRAAQESTRTRVEACYDLAKEQPVFLSPGIRRLFSVPKAFLKREIAFL